MVMRISRRSFEECVGAAWSLAEGKPFARVWGSSGYSEMQSLSSYFPKQLPGITERRNLSILSVFSSWFALQEGVRQWGNWFSFKVENICEGKLHSQLSTFETLFLEVEALSSCKTRNAAQCISNCICHSHLERNVLITFSSFFF